MDLNTTAKGTYSSANKQQGMALLMALVMMAIASSLAVAMWYDNQLALARIKNLKNNYQAKHYSQGLLLWASDILRKDYEQDDASHDSKLDSWHQGIKGMVLEDAVMSGKLVGLNGRFNLNNLIIGGTRSEQHIIYFRALLVALELDVNYVDKVIDWLDSDQIPEANGAEDFIYLAKSPSYQTSGGPFKHISELALIDGMSPEAYRQLAPYVSTLPVSGVPTKMNVNVMPPVMLNALHTKITSDMAVRLYQEGRADFQKVNDFLQHKAIQYSPTAEEKNTFKELISTQTRFLQASSLVQMDDSEMVTFALLLRNNDGSARILNRSLSPYLPQALIN